MKITFSHNASQRSPWTRIGNPSIATPWIASTGSCTRGGTVPTPKISPLRSSRQYCARYASQLHHLRSGLSDSHVADRVGESLEGAFRYRGDDLGPRNDGGRLLRRTVDEGEAQRRVAIEPSGSAPPTAVTRMAISRACDKMRSIRPQESAWRAATSRQPGSNIGVIATSAQSDSSAIS